MEIGVLALGIGGYLLGSVNAAASVARSRGFDIYATGSGNPGASNVYRVVGKWAALAVIIADIVKGFAPALVGLLAFDQTAACFAGFAAVAGHCYPILNRSRGGKGVATAGGILLAVAPLALISSALIYGILVKVTKISSVGSLVSVVASVAGAAVLGVGGWALGWYSATILLIIFRHKPNIVRLMGGSEHKVVN